MTEAFLTIHVACRHDRYTRHLVWRDGQPGAVMCDGECIEAGHDPADAHTLCVGGKQHDLTFDELADGLLAACMDQECSSPPAHRGQAEDLLSALADESAWWDKRGHRVRRA